MKISDTNIRYLHPVFAEHSGDYTSYTADITFSYEIDGDILIISSNIDLKNTYLLEKIKSGEMGLGYFVVCQDTMFNQLCKTDIGEHTQSLTHSSLFGVVEIRPVIFSNTSITDSRHQSMNDEFDDTVSFESASLTMIGSKHRFTIKPEKFQPFGSIFQLATKDDLQRGEIAVETEGDKIRILAETGTHLKLLEMRNKKQTRDLLMNAVYLPAVMETLNAIRAEEDGLEERPWFDVVLDKCKSIGIDIYSESLSVYTIAQSLMLLPVNRIFAFHEEETS